MAIALSRRSLLAGVATGALLGCSSSIPRRPAGGLRADPDRLLDVLPGFRYRVLSEEGTPLLGQPGTLVPGRFDGTAAFASANDGVVLVRNHEQDGTADHPALGPDESYVYDPGAVGGTTTIELDADGAVVDEYVSLAGTHTNCAGGPTPWGTWLTCEETEQRGTGRFRRDHGYVFEVDPAERRTNRDPTPLVALGRFAHEALAVDPDAGTVYLTEDARDPHGLVYRCEPDDPLGGPGSLRAGGELRAMQCRSGRRPAGDLSAFDRPGTELAVTWVPVPDPTATAGGPTRMQFDDGDVTRSRKLEGMWWGGGRAYLVASYARRSDGSAGEHDGQVWSYDPLTSSLRLEVVLPRSGDEHAPGEGPDNITVSPHGGLVLAEDGNGSQYLLTVDDAGAVRPFARNARNASEFAGVCFSPDGRTLYASVDSPGMTFAITGPF